MTDIPQNIRDIEVRINDIKKSKQKKSANQRAGFVMQQAFRFAAEFVSPVIIALILGYFADIFFETRPFIMLVLVVFGGAAGVLNTYRAAKAIDKDIK